MRRRWTGVAAFVLALSATAAMVPTAVAGAGGHPAGTTSTSSRAGTTTTSTRGTSAGARGTTSTRAGTSTSTARGTTSTSARASTRATTTTSTPAGPVQLRVAQAPPATLTPPPLSSTAAPAKLVLSGTPYDPTDPYLLHAHGTYLLFTTGAGIGRPHIVVHVGATIGNWTRSWEVLPTPPPWAGGNIWAPAVQRVQGGWALYFTGTVRNTSPAAQCIGAAYSTKPTGPFVPDPEPFICQLDHRGSIDPRPFVDRGGRLWMVWKSDDNADPNTPGPDQNGTTGIWVQPLSRDGRVLLGSPTEIFQPDEWWQGTIVESPQMLLVQGTYYLFFSGNWFNQPDYAIGVAQCQSVIGPCHTLGSRPFLGSNFQGLGPGEPSVYAGSTGVYLLYTPLHANTPAWTPPRPVAMARVGFSALGPYLATW